MVSHFSMALHVSSFILFLSSSFCISSINQSSSSLCLIIFPLVQNGYWTPLMNFSFWLLHFQLQYFHLVIFLWRRFLFPYWYSLFDVALTSYFPLLPITVSYSSLMEKALATLPVLLPGKSHGWRSLVGCSPWGHKESDRTERLHFHFSLSCIGEGNGNPFQCSCLENPRDGGAWWAAVYGVAQSRTRLKWLSSSSIVLWSLLLLIRICLLSQAVSVASFFLSIWVLLSCFFACLLNFLFKTGVLDILASLGPGSPNLLLLFTCVLI